MSGSRRSSSTRSGSRRRERLCAGRRALDLEALAPQALGERLGDRVLVLDEQDLHGRIVARRGRGIGALRRTFTDALPKPCLPPWPALAGAPYGREQSTGGSDEKRNAVVIAPSSAIAAVARPVAARARPTRRRLGAGVEHARRPDRRARRDARPRSRRRCAARCAAEAAGAAAAAGARRAAAPARRASSTTARRRSSSSSTPARRRRHEPSGDDGAAAAMTSHVGRLYALAVALVVFFLAWAAIAAHPGGRPAARPAAGGARGPRRRSAAARALRVKQLVRRGARRSTATRWRRGSGSRARSCSRRAPAPAVRVVNLPPLDGHEDLVIARRAFRAMGTEIELARRRRARRRRAHSTRPRRVPPARGAALALPGRVASCRAQPRRLRSTPDPISPRVVELALDARERTGGRFDPTVHDALVAAGYDRTFASSSDGPPARLPLLRRRRPRRRRPDRARPGRAARPRRDRQGLRRRARRRDARARGRLPRQRRRRHRHARRRRGRSGSRRRRHAHARARARRRSRRPAATAAAGAAAGGSSTT